MRRPPRPPQNSIDAPCSLRHPRHSLAHHGVPHLARKARRIRAKEGPGEGFQVADHVHHLRGEGQTELPLRDDTVRARRVFGGGGALAPRDASRRAVTRDPTGTARPIVNASIGATGATGRRARRSVTTGRRRRRGPRRRRPRRRRSSTAPRRGRTPTKSARASRRSTRPRVCGARRTRSLRRSRRGTGRGARSASRSGT